MHRMRFMLHYRGPLKSNGTPGHKHQLRQHFHKQLKQLWSQEPLAECRAWLQPEKDQDAYNFLRPLRSFVFVPLVTKEANTVAEISITLLRPEPPGGLITQHGDIDNRLKSLFDALSMPPHPDSLPPGVEPDDDEKPFFCLLENDILIVSVAVRTEQLLEPLKPEERKSLVDVTIAVRTRITRQVFDNSLFA